MSQETKEKILIYLSCIDRKTRRKKGDNFPVGDYARNVARKIKRLVDSVEVAAAD